MATRVETLNEHAPHAHHPPGLQHQFDNLDQQKEATTLGMWFFLVQEVMFFGGLFMAYLLYRYKYPMAFAAGSNHLDMVMGAANTVVLIVSSLTMALAVRAAQTNQKRSWQMGYIIATMIFGLTFLGVKGVEYKEKYDDNLIPFSRSFAWEPKPEVARHEAEMVEKHGNAFEKEMYTKEGFFANKVRIFFWIYFAMTGLHALHMIVGVGIMLWLLYGIYLRRYTSEFYSPVEIAGLYWHFVDIVWIFLFPMLYLLGRHFGGH